MRERRESEAREVRARSRERDVREFAREKDVGRTRENDIGLRDIKIAVGMKRRARSLSADGRPSLSLKDVGTGAAGKDVASKEEVNE